VIIFQGQKVKRQAHTEAKYGHESLVQNCFSSSEFILVDSWQLKMIRLLTAACRDSDDVLCSVQASALNEHLVCVLV